MLGCIADVWKDGAVAEESMNTGLHRTDVLNAIPVVSRDVFALSRGSDI